MLGRNNSSGLSLVELMLALTLSLFIVSSIFTLYFTAVRQQSQSVSFYLLEDNARVIHQLFSTQLKTAGYLASRKVKYYKAKDVKAGTDAMVIWKKKNIKAYFVSDTGRKNQAGQPVYALYEKDLSNKRSEKIELIEGVDALHIEIYSKSIRVFWILSSLSLQKKGYTYVAFRN